jgi:hypothetical protein
VRQRLGVYQVIDVERCEVRPEDGACDIAASDIIPGPGIPIDTAVAPADHRMRSIQIAAWEMLGAYQVAEVLARRRHRHDQANMHAVGFDENIDAFGRLFPIVVRWNSAASQRGRHIEPDHQQWPRHERAQPGPQAVDAKQFQV